MSELEQIVAKSRHASASGIGVLSTGEKLAAALVLNRPDWLAQMNYTLAEAIERVGAEWLALIPEASRRLADEAAHAGQQAEVERAEAILARPEPVEDPEFWTSLVTCGEAPGYRDASFTFDMTAAGSSRTQRARIHVRPKDAERIVGHLRHVHRFAWHDPRSRPLDAKPDERRPSWIDA